MATQESSEHDSIQTIVDSRVLAAMSHPLRRRLLDVLTVDGPSTVTMLAQRTGVAIGNVSHHLKVLDHAGLVVQAGELARDRREKWWRVATMTRRWSGRSFQGDPAEIAVAQAAASLNHEHQVAKTRAWLAETETADPAWVDAAFSTDTWLSLSSEELRTLSEQVTALLSQWRGRESRHDGAERTSVFVFARGMPAAP